MGRLLAFSVEMAGLGWYNRNGRQSLGICRGRFMSRSLEVFHVPYLEIMFGPDYEIIPVLVLTAAQDMFRFETIGGKDMVLLKRSPNLN